MYKITVTNENGESSTYEDVVAFSIIDKPLLDELADRELSDEELGYLEDAIDCSEDFPNATLLEEFIERL